jgi:hypothetical protein
MSTLHGFRTGSQATDARGVRRSILIVDGSHAFSPESVEVSKYGLSEFLQSYFLMFIETFAASNFAAVSRRWWSVKNPF